MAKRNEQNNNDTLDDDESLPAGFVEQTRKNVDGWFALEKGNKMQGILRGSFTAPSQFARKGKTVYKVELTIGGQTKAVDGDGETVVMDKGDLVGIDEKGWLTGLADIEEDTEVFIRYRGKDPSQAKPGQSAPHIFQIAAVPI